ncbi:MAG: ANTAR domain-containing protein [Pseudomonadota bacterium]|nr:ANTAR domain-containing protein [Pseudomonadota bacterium]
MLYATPQQLKDLRQLKIVVIHPDDADGQLLTQQLQRIGCQVQPLWPPVQSLPGDADVVFMVVRPDYLHLYRQLRTGWARGTRTPTLIAVVNYENPTIVSAVLELEAQAILPSPVRSFGLLSTLVLARKTHKQLSQQQQHIAKLQTKLLGQRHVTEAKAILMRTHQVSERQAYDLLREQAMNKRSSIEGVAAAIVQANELLSLKKS